MTQLPSPQHRHPTPQHVKRLRPKTYSVAVYLVIAVIMLQVVMLISVFWLRAMVVSVKVNMPKNARPGMQASTTQTLIGPVPPKPDLRPPLPSLPSISMTIRQPALLSVPTSSDKKEQIINLNDEAKAFLKQHALESALDTLLKAEDIDPRFPDTLENLAETYNLMNDPVHSKIYWQRLVDIGPAVGTIYAAAKDHVQLLNTGHDADTLSTASVLPRQVYVDYVEKTPIETLNGQAQFRVRATLTRRSPHLGVFEQKKLQPYVIFYQQMPDGSLVPDLNQRKGSFDDTFLFWGGKTSETFGVDYLMPVPGALGPNQAPMGEYYGFVIGIYYDKMLQDARSEPSDLITRIPLPDEIE